MHALKRIIPVIIMLGTVTAIAQPDPTPAPAPAATGSAAVAPVATVQLSVGEMKQRTVVLQSQMQTDYQHVVGLREKVRKMKDVIKLDCVNDRLVQLKAQMNIADKANQSFQSVVDRDATQGRDLFGQYESSAHNIKELREQANQCVGEGDLYKQEAGLEVTRPPDLVDDPGTTDPMAPDGAVVEPPGYASAFM
jgi:hypothetical protein